jgi:hypothetical protein
MGQKLLEAKVIYGQVSLVNFVYDARVEDEKLGPYAQWGKQDPALFAKQIRKLADNQDYVRGIGVGRRPSDDRIVVIFELTPTANAVPKLFGGSPDIYIVFHEDASFEAVVAGTERLVRLFENGKLETDEDKLLAQTVTMYNLYMFGK